MKTHVLVGRVPYQAFASATFLASALLLALPSYADTFSVQYFQVPVGSPDFHTGGAPTGVSNNYVLSTLSGGMPVFNPAFTSASGTVVAPLDLGAGNQITWWTPSVSTGVVSTGTGPLTVGSTPVTMFPPNSTGFSDGNDEETAILTESINLAGAQAVTFNVNADDDAFVYVDGTLVEDLAGIHGATSAPANTVNLAAGPHTVQIFYADQEEVAAQLSFSDNAVLGPATTPEPSSLALLGTGVLVVSGLVRRRSRA